MKEQLEKTGKRWVSVVLGVLVCGYIVQQLPWRTFVLTWFTNFEGVTSASNDFPGNYHRYLSNGNEGEKEDLSHVLVLLFMFFGLSLGIFLMQLLSHVGEAIPYTVLVFLMGVMFDAISHRSGGSFFDSIHRWQNIDADLMLFIFLPPLVFGEAMNLNWYHVTRAFWQSIILAGPGVWIGAAMMGSLTKVLLPYNWSWVLCFVFGSIMAATDTVAVVSLLHSVGASPKLTILVVGESLINDGSAMALFTLFFQALQGQTYTVASVVSFCVATVFGSVLLGIGFGIVCVRWLKSANNPLEERDITIQIAITFCCAYLSFFTAQYALELSGVLSCCAAGAVFACLAPRIILQHESMHNVWSIAEWGLNTMIFLLAGLMIGHRVLDEVNAMDWVYMLVLYVALVAARFLTMLILYPLISRIGHGCSLKEVCFMSWAGLRGALGMALAVIVHKGMEHHDKELAKETSRLLFYVGGISAMTLIVNATTSKHVLFGLGLLSTNSAEKQLVTNQVKKKLRKKMNRVISQLTKELSLRTEDLDIVRDACSLLQDMNMDTLYRESEQLMLSKQLRLTSPLDNHSILDKTVSGPKPATFFTTIPLETPAAIPPATTTYWKNNADSDANFASSLSSYGVTPTSYESHFLGSSPQQRGDIQKGRTNVQSLPTRLRKDSNNNGVSHPVEEEDNLTVYSGTHSLPARQVFSQAKGRFEEENNLHCVGSNDGDDEDQVDDSSVYTDGTRSTARILAKTFSRDNKSKTKTQKRKKHSSLPSFGRIAGDAASVVSGMSGRTANTAATKSRKRTLSSAANSFYLSSSHLSAQIEASEANRLDYFSRLVSIGSRDARTILDEDLLAYVRSIFLEIIRVKYWHLIEVGKLPKISHSAQYLLYTIEVALDDVQNVRDRTKAALLSAHKSANAHQSGTYGYKKMSFSAAAAMAGTTSAKYVTADWRCLQEDLNYRPVVQRVGEWVESFWFSLCNASNSNMSNTSITSKQRNRHSKTKKAKSYATKQATSTSDTTSRRNQNHNNSRNINNNNSNWYHKWSVSQWLDRDGAIRDKRAVYMLTAFIEAHEHAQRKLHQFLGGLLDQDHHHHDNHDNPVGEYMAPAPPDSPGSVGDTHTHITENLSATPEESKVLAESKDAVMRARKRLNEIPKDIVQDIRSRQVSRMVLAKEAELVKNMVEEGLLSSQHAAVFMEEIRSDIRNIEDDREQLYHEKHQQAHQQQQQKKHHHHHKQHNVDRPSDIIRQDRHKSMRQKMLESLSLAHQNQNRKNRNQNDEEMRMLSADYYAEDADDSEEEKEEEIMSFGDLEQDGQLDIMANKHQIGISTLPKESLYYNNVVDNNQSHNSSSTGDNVFENDHAALLASIVSPEEDLLYQNDATNNKGSSNKKFKQSSPWDAMKSRTNNINYYHNGEEDEVENDDYSVSSASVGWSHHSRDYFRSRAEDEEDDEDEAEEEEEHVLRSRQYSGFLVEDDDDDDDENYNV